MREATLESAELAYLLATLGAESVFGVDNTALFPDSEAEKERLYEQGLELLRKNKWITPGEETGRENLNSELMVMVEVMMRSPLVIVTGRRQGQEGTRRRMVHYLMDYMIIEQVHEADGRYRLSKAADPTAAMLRIVSTVGVPETSAIGMHRAESDEVTVAAIKEAAKAGDSEAALARLSDLGLDANPAQNFVDAIADPAQRGSVSVMWLDGRLISDIRGLAYFVREGDCWLVTRPDVNSEEVTLQTATASTLWEILTVYVDDLKQQSAAS